MNLDYGAAGQVFIRNLAVEYAQMIGASIGNLCIKASDGQYYSIDVDSSGNVTGTLTTVTEQKIDAGQTDSGRVILETSITASEISTSSLLATYALVNQIDAARIDVDQLFARQAFIKPRLTPHFFRHNYVTLLYESGVDPLIEMKIVGHTDYQNTANIYTHVRDEMLKKATVNMNEVFQKRTEE